MTTKQRILNHFEDHSGWLSGAELQLQAANWRTTGSTISRRCRELADENKLERLLSNRRTVMYRKPIIVPLIEVLPLEIINIEQGILL